MLHAFSIKSTENQFARTWPHLFELRSTPGLSGSKSAQGNRIHDFILKEAPAEPAFLRKEEGSGHEPPTVVI